MVKTLQSLSLTGEVRINTSTAGNQYVPEITTFSDGTSLVVWGGQDDSGNGIRARRLDASGSPVGAEFTINATTQGGQSIARIAKNDDDSYTIYWQSSGQADGVGVDIVGQRFDATGSAIGNEFIVNTTTANTQFWTQATTLADGRHIVTWANMNANGTMVSVSGRIMAADGTAVGDDFVIGSISGVSTTNWTPTLTALTDGGFLSMWKSSDGGGTGVYGRRYDAGGNATGDAFRINTTVSTDQQIPGAVALPDGGFVVSWTSGRSGGGNGVYAQRYDAGGDALGGEFLVNTQTAANQYASRVRALPDGGFVVIYMAGDDQDGSGAGIYAQRYDGGGGRIGGEFRVTDTTYGDQDQVELAVRDDGSPLVTWASPDGSGQGIFSRIVELTSLFSSERQLNQTVSGSQGGSASVVLADGSSVVAWHSYGQDGGGWGVYGRRLDASGAPVGSEFRLTTTVSGDQAYPTLQALADGGFIAYWGAMGMSGGNGAEIAGQRFDAVGNKVGSEFVVNTTISANQISPTSTALVNGKHVVSWLTMDANGTTPVGVWARIIGTDGTPQGGDFLVNGVANVGTAVFPPSISALADGGFIVFVQSYDGSSTGIYGQRYTADGARAVEGTYQVNSTTANTQQAPAAALLADGSVVVTWTSNGQDGGGNGIYAQRYDAGGDALGGEFLVNTQTAANQYASRVRALPDGGFVVIYMAGDDQDGSGAGIYAQRYDGGGGRIGGEFRVTDTTYGDQDQVELAVRDDGSLLVTWASPDGSGQGIFSRIVELTSPYQVTTGTIAGDDLTADPSKTHIMGLGGDDTLHGGLGADRLDGDGGDDVVYLGQGDVATGGDGYDTLIVDGNFPLTLDVGGSGFEVAFGNDGADKLWTSLSTPITLYGGGGNDSLSGGGGNDSLNGGSGADSLVGGLGDDTYVVDDAGDVVVENVGEGTDTVLTDLATYTLPENVENLEYTGSGDFSGTGNGLDNVLTGGSGNDTLDGGGGADTLIGGTGNDTYVVDDAGDVVTENAGGGTDTVLTDLGSYTLPENVEHLTYTGSGDFAGTGNGSANTLTGGAGSDTLSGLGGNDWLDGGSGADSLIGGTGNDTYVVDDAGDVVVENAGEGTDTVRTSLNTYTLPDNVENVVFTGSGDFTVTGNDLNNSLAGGSGQDTLIGLAGNDTLNGGSGADTMIGGTGNDTYIVDDVGDVVSELPGEGTDTVKTGLGSYTLGDDVENLTHTGSSPFTGTGNGLDNSLTGGSGVDTLYGLDGNDTLNGGSGADTLVGGTGDDTYIVDNAGDVVTELSGEGADTVKSGITYTLPDNVENLILTGSNDIDGTGNGLDNTITGNGGDNTLDGGTGADTLIGGAGDDVYVVDDAGDVVTENAGQGFDEVRTDLSSYTLPANVEKLTYTGSGDFAGTGNGLDNVLNGAGGNDTLSGGDGDDTLAGGAGADVLDGGAGSDTADYSTSGQAVAVDLGAGTASGGDAAGDTLTSIENLTGSAHDDVLTGDGGDNVLIGGAGADTLTGGAGTDTASYAPSTSGVAVDLASGTGTAGDAAGDVLSGIENLTGGSGDDILRGDGGANVLDGGAGNDTLEGRGGDDMLIGGSGTDTAVLSGNVADYLATDDGGSWTFADLVGGDGTDTLIGVERVQFADRLIYLDGTNNAPIVSENLSETTDEDAAPLAVNLTAGAWDFDGEAVSAIGVTQTGGYAVDTTFLGGVLTLDPAQLNHLALGESALLTFAFDITDGSDATARSLSVTVEGRNDAPTVAAPLTATTDEDAGVVNLNLLQGASDVDLSDTLSVTGLTQTGGTGVDVTLVGGTLSLDTAQLTGLAVGESAVLTFAYDVTDGTASTAQTMTVTVDGRNDGPTAGADQYRAWKDTAKLLTAAMLLANDGDPDTTDTPSIVSVGNAVNGSVTMDAQGYISFTPTTGQTGPASFSYTLSDGHGGTSQGDVSLTIQDPTSATDNALSIPTLGHQNDPTAITLANGNTLGLWYSYSPSDNAFHAKARRFDPSGDLIDTNSELDLGTIVLPTSTYHVPLRDHLKATALPDGGFMLQYLSKVGSKTRVTLQRFDEDGTRLNPAGGTSNPVPITVNTDTWNYVVMPRVGLTGDGRYMAIWEGHDGSGQGDIVGQMFNADGSVYSNQFLINTSSTAHQMYPEVTQLAGGGFVVTWSSGNTGMVVEFQRFSDAGQKMGNVSRVSVESGTQEWPMISALADGGWVTVWQQAPTPGGNYSVRGQVFNADGTQRGSSFMVNQEDTDFQGVPRVSGMADGGFAVSWSSQATGRDDGKDQWARRFDAQGTALGDEFRLNVTTAGDQSLSALASLGDDRLLALYTSPDGSNDGVNWRTFGTPTDGVGVIAGGGGDDMLIGGDAADELYGYSGNDTLTGGLGADTLTGGLGADVFHFESPDVGLDTITDFQSGVDVIEVVSANFDDLAVGQLDGSRFALNTAADADTRFVFDTTTRVLSYDADGTGVGAAVGLATLNVSTLSNTNIFVV